MRSCCTLALGLGGLLLPIRKLEVRERERLAFLLRRSKDRKPMLMRHRFAQLPLAELVLGEAQREGYVSDHGVHGRETSAITAPLSSAISASVPNRPLSR